MNRFFLAVTICSLLTACGSAPRVLPNNPAGTACIHGGLANAFRQFSKGEAHVTVSSQADPHAGPYRKHFVPAGKNTITVIATWGSTMAIEPIIVSLKAGREYVVRAHLVNIDTFHFAIVDTSTSPETTAYEFDSVYKDPRTLSASPRDLTLSSSP